MHRDGLPCRGCWERSLSCNMGLSQGSHRQPPAQGCGTCPHGNVPISWLPPTPGGCSHSNTGTYRTPQWHEASDRHRSSPQPARGTHRGTLSIDTNVRLRLLAPHPIHVHTKRCHRQAHTATPSTHLHPCGCGYTRRDSVTQTRTHAAASPGTGLSNTSAHGHARSPSRPAATRP